MALRFSSIEIANIADDNVTWLREIGCCERFSDSSCPIMSEVMKAMVSSITEENQDHTSTDAGDNNDYWRSHDVKGIV